MDIGKKISLVIIVFTFAFVLAFLACNSDSTDDDNGDRVVDDDDSGPPDDDDDDDADGPGFDYDQWSHCSDLLYCAHVRYEEEFGTIHYAVEGFSEPIVDFRTWKVNELLLIRITENDLPAQLPATIKITEATTGLGTYAMFFFDFDMIEDPFNYVVGEAYLSSSATIRIEALDSEDGSLATVYLEDAEFVQVEFTTDTFELIPDGYTGRIGSAGFKKLPVENKVE